MHPRISINTLSLAPASLGKHIDLVARLDCKAISPDLMHVEEYGIAETAWHIGQAGLEIATLTHRAFGFATPDETAKARARLDRTIGIAAEIGAQTIIMTTGGRGTLTWAEAADRFSEAIAPCVETARGTGVKIGIEPTSHLYADASIVHRLADTANVARKAGITVIPDIFACWVDADLEEAIAEAGPAIALIQVSDYVHGDRGLPCRAVPGDGEIPFERLVPAFEAAGFTGYYDLEIIGPRLQSEGEEEGLKRAAEHIAACLEGVPE
jgi:sugar phosphate isomerase/epimerase